MTPPETPIQDTTQGVQTGATGSLERLRPAHLAGGDLEGERGRSIGCEDEAAHRRDRGQDLPGADGLVPAGLAAACVDGHQPPVVGARDEEPVHEDGGHVHRAERCLPGEFRGPGGAGSGLDGVGGGVHTEERHVCQRGEARRCWRGQRGRPDRTGSPNDDHGRRNHDCPHSPMSAHLVPPGPWTSWSIPSPAWVDRS